MLGDVQRGFPFADHGGTSGTSGCSFHNACYTTTMTNNREMQKAINRSVSQRLRRLRQRSLKLSEPATQAEFAEITGLSKSTIVNIENNRQGATLAALYTIAAALDMEVADLLPTIAEIRATVREPNPDTLEEALPEWADWLEQSADQLRPE